MDTTSQQKPREVKLAANLLWVSLGIGLLILAAQFDYLRSQASVEFIVAVAAITFGISALLVYFISVGRNWSRITYLVLFLLGLVPAVPQLAATFQRSGLIGTLSVAQWLLQAIALYLIFWKPGANWYRKRPS